ncbi:hypothetical protein BDZ91DRAFT_782704 [Kalaharituber pfeilii]|nr:hypothetical protein BDZ91DRAFT_782704 [Kalaharituber pfeilii]
MTKLDLNSTHAILSSLIKKDLGVVVPPADIHIRIIRTNREGHHYWWNLKGNFRWPSKPLERWTIQDKVRIIRAWRAKKFWAVDCAELDEMTEDLGKGQDVSSREILSCIIDLDLGEYVPPDNIHVRRLCGREWLWNYWWRIRKGSKFEWPIGDPNSWGTEDKLKVIAQWQEGKFQAVKYRP